MVKILSINDLIQRKKFENSSNNLEELSSSNKLYDLIIPLGTPKSLIYDIIETFNLEIKNRTFQSENPDLNVVNTIVLRGDIETIKKAEEFMYKEIEKWINSLKKN